MIIKDRIYVGALTSVCEQMDHLTESEEFNMNLAKRLHNKYVKLAKKTYANESLSKGDIYSWSLAFSHAYEPSSFGLNLRILYELQKSQNLQNKTEKQK
jgi:hypothetical protein